MRLKEIRTFYIIRKILTENNTDPYTILFSSRQRWLDVVRKDLEELNPDRNGNLDLAYARKIWGELVLEAKSLNGS